MRRSYFPAPGTDVPCCGGAGGEPMKEGFMKTNQSRIVKIKTKLLSQNMYNRKNVFGALKRVSFKSVKYDWDDPNPDVVTWEHFLEREFARMLKIRCIPWSKVMKSQRKEDLKAKELRMAISVPGHFLVGILSWQ